MFGKRGLLLILLVTLFTAFGVFGADYIFTGIVLLPNGTVASSSANVSLDVPSFVTAMNPSWNGSCSNVTNSTGGFWINVTGGVDDASNLKLSILVITANQIENVTFIGPNLPPFPNSMYQNTGGPSLYGQTFYTKKAGIIWLRVFNETGWNGDVTDNGVAIKNNYTNFSYIVRDTNLGSEVASYMAFPPTGVMINETKLYLPLSRNYSITVFPLYSPPLDYAITNFSFYNLTGNNDSEGVVHMIDLRFNTSTNQNFFDGFVVNSSGGIINSSAFTNFQIWFTAAESGSFVCANDNCLRNISQMQGPYTTTNASAALGYYNFTFPGTRYGFDAVLFALINTSDGRWFFGVQNITSSRGAVQQIRQNITVHPIAGGAGNYISGTNLKLPQTLVRLINSTNSALNNIGNGMLVAEVDYGLAFIPKFQIELNNSGIATFPFTNNTGIKSIKVYIANYPPRDTKFTASEMDGDISITLYNNQVKNFDGSSNLGATMEMYVSNATCDVMTPPASCLVSSGTDSAFNPMTAILRGAVSMRMLLPGGMILHYRDVDLLSSGPPDFIADESATSYSSVSGTLNDAWRLGSRGPKIYDGVLVGFNYTASKPDLGAPFTVALKTLYDSDNVLIWNTTANGSLYGSITANFSDFSDYNNTWFSGRSCNTTITGTLDKNNCFYNQSTYYLWFYLPHFSGSGPEVQGITAGNITLNITSRTSCNVYCEVYFNVTNSNFTISQQYVNWTINVTTNKTTRFRDSTYIYYMNATNNTWYVNGTNISYYNVYNLTYYNATSANTIWNTTHMYRINITRTSNVSEQITVNYTLLTAGGVTFDLTQNVTIACIETWDNPEWSTCSGGMQTRTCTDSAKCGTTAIKPSESQACTTGSSGPGGGGGASSSVTWLKMIAGQTYTYDVPDKTIAFERLTVVPNTDLTNVKVVVRQLPEQPSDVIKAPVGTVFKYMSIAKEGITNTQMQRAAVKFGIDKSWVDGKGKKENIALLRYVGDKWEKLTPKYIGEENGKYKYEADTPGFSYFAINFQTPEEQTKQEQQDKETASAETAPETAEPENVFEEKEAKKSSWWIVVTALVVVLAVVIAFYFVYKHKKKSGSLEGYRYKPRH